MLLPRIRRPPRVLPLHNRYYSDAVPVYSSKVRAIPFGVSEKTASKTMAMYATMTFAGKNLNLSTIWRMLFSTLGGPAVVTPQRVQAVYLPAWIIDAQLSSKVSENDTQRITSVQLVDAYLPAFNFDFMSRIALNSTKLDPNESVPVSQVLSHQDVKRITCLPYTVSPFSLLEKLCSSRQTIRASDSIRFDSNVKDQFMAAYPVLLPLYLGQYELDGRSTTVILEGHAPMERVWFQLFVEDLLIRGATKTFMINHVDGDWYQAQGSPTSFSNVSLPGHPRKSADALRTWLDKRISEPGALEEFAKGSKPVEWGESGIRPYTKEEVDANRTYLGLGAQIAEAKETLETCREAEESGDDATNTLIIKVDSNGVRKLTGTKFREYMEEEVNQLEETQKSLLPSWKAGDAKPPHDRVDGKHE